MLYYLRTTHTALGKYRLSSTRPLRPLHGLGVQALSPTEYETIEDIMYEHQAFWGSANDAGDDIGPMPTREQIQADLDIMVADGSATAFEDMHDHKPDCPCQNCEEEKHRSETAQWLSDREAERRNELWFAFDQHWRPIDGTNQE